ncbi:hypothetical protein TNCV_3242691 [Trichonephila clavipes]|nr:hypothetical protein TNCV_3242691 [Trichonephila clavipes]
MTPSGLTIRRSRRNMGYKMSFSREGISTVDGFSGFFCPETIPSYLCRNGNSFQPTQEEERGYVNLESYLYWKLAVERSQCPGLCLCAEGIVKREVKSLRGELAVK